MFNEIVIGLLKMWWLIVPLFGMLGVGAILERRMK